MDLTPYVDNLRRDLAVAANAGGEDARALAERLTAPLESATRLALLGALSAAADEITRELAPGSVDVRLRGLNPDFVVVTPPLEIEYRHPPEKNAEQPLLALSPDTDDGAVSRINFRLPEHLKQRIEEAAGNEGLSINAWLVRVATAALEPGGHGRRAERRSGHGAQSYTGWVR